MPDDERHLAVPEPDVIRVSADDVIETGQERLEREVGKRFREQMHRYEDALFYGNLRTPEADAPDREEPSWARDAIGQSIEHVEDPSLRRALLEEFHRDG